MGLKLPIELVLRYANDLNAAKTALDAVKTAGLDFSEYEKLVTAKQNALNDCFRKRDSLITAGSMDKEVL